MVRLEDIPRYLDFRHFDPVAEDHMRRFAYMVSITLHFLSSAYLPCRYLDEQGTGGQWSRTTLVPLARQLRWIVHGQDQDLRMRLSYIGTSRACLHACMQVASITAWDPQFNIRSPGGSRSVAESTTRAAAEGGQFLKGAKHFRSIVAAGCAADWSEKNITSETARICCAGEGVGLSAWGLGEGGEGWEGFAGLPWTRRPCQTVLQRGQNYFRCEVTARCVPSMTRSQHGSIDLIKHSNTGGQAAAGLA